MTLTRFDRQVFLVKYRVSSYPVSAPSVPVLRTLAIIKELFESGATEKFFDEKGDFLSKADVEKRINEGANTDSLGNLMFIQDIVETDKTFAVLINRATVDATDPAFWNRKQNKVVPIKRGDGESPAFSGHLIIDKTGIGGTETSHRAVIDRVPHLSRTIVQSYLRRLMKEYAEDNAEFTYKKKKGKKEETTEPFRPIIHVANQATTSLEEDIKKGRITSVEFIRRTSAYAGLNQLPRVTGASERLILRFERGGVGRDQLTWLNSARETALEAGYDEVLVKLDDLPNGGSSSPRFAVEKAEAADVLYSRCELIENLPNELAQCTEKVDNDLASSMIKFLTSAEFWR